MPSSKERRARPKPVPRDETKQRTREALVRAALELFAEQGLDAPSLDAICERAGFTRGAFYVHFRDREELLVAVMDHVGAAFLSSVFTGLSADEHRSARRRGAIRIVAERFVDAVKSGAYPLMKAEGERPAVRMHQLLDACARAPAVRERYRGLVEASVASVASLVSDDQHARVVRGDVDQAVIGRLLLAIVIGAQTMAELGVAIDPDRLARTVLRMLDPPE